MRKKIAIQVMDNEDRDWISYSVEPLEQVGEDAWDEGEDYEDREQFHTWKEAATYAKELVKEYKARGDDAWWVDAR